MKPPQQKKKSSVALPAIEKNKDYKPEIIIAVVAILSFGLSVFNDYALDDFIVLVQNTFVQKGVSGIWKILSKDTFAGMTGVNVMVLSGGRYRPLSVVTFAIEHQLWGNQPFISHLLNVLLYATSGILLYRLMKQLIGGLSANNKVTVGLQSFITTILFISMPVHSEPVINIKGRDDLLCLLFFLLAAFQLLKYAKTNYSKHFGYSLMFYFLSLMSKETALTFVLVFPLMLFYFTKKGASLRIKTIAGYLSIALLFLMFRYLATKDNGGTISNDVLNNPFVHTSVAERYATIFVSWLYYLKMMIWPQYMSYDYNYNQFPVVDFTSWKAILSLVTHAGLLIIAFVQIRRKTILSFGILFYFITFSILSNFFFNIGSMFADRFLFIPSIGFCIAIVDVIFSRINFEKTSKQTRLVLTVIFSLIVVASGARNIIRCRDWKNNNTLFIADTESAPQSAKIHLNAGIAYISMSEKKDSAEKNILLHNAMIELQKGIAIYPSFIDGYQNMGVAYNWLGDYEKAEEWWNKARAINPNNKQMKIYDGILSAYYFRTGIDYGTQNKFPECIDNLRHALKYDSANAELTYNLGGAYFTIRNADSAGYFFRETLRINPQFQKAAEGLQALGMPR